MHTKLHPGLEWRIFHILTSKDMDDSLSLKLFFNSLVYDRSIFRSPSKVDLRKSSGIFGNRRKFSGNVLATRTFISSRHRVISYLLNEPFDPFSLSHVCCIWVQSTHLFLQERQGILYDEGAAFLLVKAVFCLSRYSHKTRVTSQRENHNAREVWTRHLFHWLAVSAHYLISKISPVQQWSGKGGTNHEDGFK